MSDDLSYLDGLLAEDDDRDGSTPPAAPSSRGVGGDPGFFTEPVRAATSDDAVAPATPPPGRPGARPLPPPTPARMSRPPASNRLGPVALFCGTVALALGIALPFMVLLVLITALGGLVIGGMTVHHAVNTGAPGRWLGLGGIVTAAIGMVLMFVALADASRGARTAGQELAGMVDGLETLSLAADIQQLSLPGTGSATVTLDDVEFTVPLDRCGFADPTAGVALAGHGRDPEEWSTAVAFTSRTLGQGRDVVVVEVGGSSYARRVDEGLFVRDGDTVVAEGEFRELPGGSVVTGRIEATCSS